MENKPKWFRELEEECEQTFQKVETEMEINEEDAEILIDAVDDILQVMPCPNCIFEVLQNVFFLGKEIGYNEAMEDEPDVEVMFTIDKCNNIKELSEQIAKQLKDSGVFGDG